MDFLKVEYPPYGFLKLTVRSKTTGTTVENFHFKEQAKIKWIQKLEKNSVLIDIGAKTGIDTLLAALHHVKKVISVEPNIDHYNILLNNIELNGLRDKVDALPLAISTRFANSLSNLRLIMDQPGVSFQQADQNQDHKLKDISVSRKSSCIYSVSLSSLVQNVYNEYSSSPIHVKLDVDGSEEDVLQSLFDCQSLNYIDSLQIRLNPALIQHDNIIKRLHMHGFSYLKAQASTASITMGKYKNFVDYVFLRYASNEIIEKLPSYISAKFTSTTSVNDERDISGFALGVDGQFNSDQLFLDKSYVLSALSTTPPALSIGNFLTSLECLSAYNSISKCISKSFEFKSLSGFEQKSECARWTVSSRKLHELDKPYVRFLIRFGSNISMLRVIFKASLPLLKKYVHLSDNNLLMHGKKVYKN